MPRLAQIVLTAWAGSLWTICGFAPLLFWNFERGVAGSVATVYFETEALVSAVLGIVYVLLRRRFGPPLDRRTAWMAGITIAAPLSFYLVVRPLIAAAKAAGDTVRFGMLHSASSVLFVAACLGALLLVLRSAETKRSA